MTTANAKPAWFEEFEKENAAQHAAVQAQLEKLDSKVSSVYALASATSVYVNDLPNTMKRLIDERLSS